MPGNCNKKYRSTKQDDSTQIQFTPIIEYTKNADQTVTQITDLTLKRRPTNVFMDLGRDGKIITMIDYVNYGCLPERTDLCCAHCHHQFPTSPIGIPIRYIRKRPDKVQPDDAQTVGTNDYFLTANVVCSFPCLLAFVNEHSNDPLYRQSKSLTYSLYYKLYQEELTIKPAPSWECLKIHGGHLSIEEFRANFCTCSYTITPNIKRPFMVAVGKYVEERNI